MESNNPADEYRRLEELYAEMSVGQLQKIADQASDLTDIAQEVLRAEVSKRGLDKPTPNVSAEDFILSDEGMTRVWRMKDQAKARSVIDSLESAGIPACLVPEKVEFIDGSFEDWVNITVVQSDQARAIEFLNQYFPRELEPEEEAGKDDERLAVCPSCHSPDIVFQNLDKVSAPGTTAKYNWTCDACGHQWKDDGLEQLA
jgi:DNA-directed RNA polymerase subunit M/transcription elongation factor TFIIS